MKEQPTDLVGWAWAGGVGGGSKVFASFLDPWCCTDRVGNAVEGVGVGEDGEFRISVVMCCVLRVLSSVPGPWRGTEVCKEGWTLTRCGALPGASHIPGAHTVDDTRMVRSRSWDIGAGGRISEEATAATAICCGSQLSGKQDNWEFQ